jgi:hypothetical protein
MQTPYTPTSPSSANTMKRIIYQNESGGISVIIPTGELSIEGVAQKDVPAGVPYLLADVADIPEDRTFRGAWEADFSNPDGYGIGADAYFAAKEAAQ